MLSSEITRMLPGNSHSQLGRRPTYCAGVKEVAVRIRTGADAAAAAHVTWLLAANQPSFLAEHVLCRHPRP